MDQDKRDREAFDEWWAEQYGACVMDERDPAPVNFAESGYLAALRHERERHREVVEAAVVDGFKQGLYAHARHVDGRQVVGTMDKPLSTAYHEADTGVGFYGDLIASAVRRALAALDGGDDE